MKYSIFVITLLLPMGSILEAAPEMVMVSDLGNEGKAVPFGEVKKVYPRGTVNYPYRMAVREVSNAEYADFLNACAADVDRYKLYDERMGITRSRAGSGWHYAAEPGKAAEPVVYVSRVNAARYCNYLTSGSPDQGAYKIGDRFRESGISHEVIIGHRDTTFPDSPIVYYLPDMHEFFKAGWYDGKGDYRVLDEDSRDEPSHYGIREHATGVREWMENKYYGANPIALGASSWDSGEDVLNTVRYFHLREDEGNERTGFRVAATAPLQIGNRLNSSNNFFFDGDQRATLRIRYDGAPRTVDFKLELRNFRDEPVWAKSDNIALRSGVNELSIELPERDGYYELRVTPEVPFWEGETQVIPLAVMREPMPPFGAEGNFGFTAHIVRREKRWSFEDTDFDLYHRLGVSQVRVDVERDDTSGSQTVLKRVHDAGLNPLGIITSRDVRSFKRMQEEAKNHPELVEKWAAYDVPAELALYAENVYKLVGSFRGIVKDWEFGNEPTYWDILPQDYAQILKAGYKAAKLANPDANVMAGDLNAIHAPVLTLGAGEFSDSVATHIYGFYVPMFWGIAGKMRELNGWLEAAGEGDQPVWITEIGGATYNSMHLIPVREMDEVRRYQALHQPKVMAGGLAYGATKVIPYNLRDTPSDYYEEEFGMIDRYGMPKPAIATYRTTARLLGNASFIGFIEGHSLKEGEVAGFHFRDEDGQDVLVFWRNDAYGYNKFEIPFPQIIGKTQKVKVPASGTTVELFDMSGGRSELAVRDGRVAIDVNEYPVFVRGRLNPVHTDVETAHPVLPVQVPAAKVSIRPDYKSRACDLMAGVVLNLTRDSDAKVEVTVYNTEDKPLRGTLRLVPRSNWREWPWEVIPVEAKLDIMPDGMMTTAFHFMVPDESDPTKIYYLDAIFSTENGGEFRDTVAFHVIGKKTPVSEWTSYTPGVRLKNIANNTEIRVEVPAEKSGFVSFYRLSPMSFAPLAHDAKELNKDVTISINPHQVELQAVSLLLRDSKGEVFQLKQSVQMEDDQWGVLRFHLADVLGRSVIVHRGGDGVVDYPLSLQGFNFDHAPTGVHGGVILVRDMDIVPPLSLWRLGDWNVYGEGFRNEGLNDARNELRITRGKTGRNYVTLGSHVRPLLAENGSDWPKKVEIGYRYTEAPVTAVSLLVVDSGGEIYQLKQMVNASAGSWQTATFDLQNLASRKDLIVYGGDQNKQIDFPVRLYGFNFDFSKREEEVQLFLTPPEIVTNEMIATDNRWNVTRPAGGGGGAADMN